MPLIRRRRSAFNIAATHAPAAGGGSGGGGPPPDSAESAAWLSRAGSVAEPARTYIKTFIDQCVADGNYQYLDFAYWLSADTEAHARLDLSPNAYNALTDGPVNWTAGRGYTGNGSSFFMNTGGFVPATAGKNMSAGNAMLGYYSLTPRTAGQAWAGMGGYSDGFARALTLFGKYSSDSNAYFQVGTPIVNSTLAMADAKGLLMGRWDGTNAELWKMFDGTHNGLVHTALGATGSHITVEPLIFATNNSGGVANYTGDELAFAFGGGKNINPTTFAAALQTLMTSQGIATS